MERQTVVVNDVEFIRPTSGLVNLSTENYSTVIDRFSIRKDGKIVFSNRGLYTEKDISYLTEVITGLINEKES